MKKRKLASISLDENLHVIEDNVVLLGHFSFAFLFVVVSVPFFVLSLGEGEGGSLKGRGRSKFS